MPFALALSAVFALGVEKMSRGKDMSEDLGVQEKLWRHGPAAGDADPVIREAVQVQPDGVHMAFAELENALHGPAASAPASLAEIEHTAHAARGAGALGNRTANRTSFGTCTVKLYRGTNCDRMTLDSFTTQSVSGQKFMTPDSSNASSLTRSINVETSGGCRFVEVYDDDSVLSRDDKKYTQPSGCIKLPNDLQEDIRGIHLAVQVPEGMQRECKFGLYRDSACTIKHIGSHSTTEPEGKRFKMQGDARSLPLAIKAESEYCEKLEVIPGMLGGLLGGSVKKQIISSPANGGCTQLKEHTKENVAKVFAVPNYGAAAAASQADPVDGAQPQGNADAQTQVDADEDLTQVDADEDLGMMA